MQANSFVLISASTSDKLLQRVHGKLAGKAVGSVTILSLRPQGLEKDSPEEKAHLEGCLFSVPRKLELESSLGGLRTDFFPDLTTIPEGSDTIKIVGERFVSQHVKPRLVRIVGSALDDGLKRALHKIADLNLMRAAVPRQSGKGVYSLYPDLVALVDHATDASTGPEALRIILRNHAPAGPVTLIYPAGHGSAPRAYVEQARRLADAAAAMLQQGGQSVTVYSSEELPGGSQPDPQGVVVLAPVIGDGFFF